MTIGFSLGSLFFVAGAAASYFYLVPHTLSFFWDDAHKMQVNPLWTWKSYISIFTWLTLGFGLMCEVPLVIILLASIGIVNYKFLASTRAYAITILFVLAAIVAEYGVDAGWLLTGEYSPSTHRAEEEAKEPPKARVARRLDDVQSPGAPP